MELNSTNVLVLIYVQHLISEKGFSATTLKYTKYFYELYAPLFAGIKFDTNANTIRLHGVDDS